MCVVCMWLLSEGRRVLWQEALLFKRPQSHTHKTQGRSISQGQGNKTVSPGLGVSKVEIMLEWPRRRCPVVPSEMEEMENQRKFDLPLMWPCTVLKQWPSPKTLSLCKLCSDATATFYLIGVFTFSLPMYTYLDQVRRAVLPSAFAHTIHFSW